MTPERNKFFWDTWMAMNKESFVRTHDVSFESDDCDRLVIKPNKEMIHKSQILEDLSETIRSILGASS